MQETRSCGEISLIMLSHLKIMHFLWNSPVMQRDLARSASRKKICQHPLDKMCLSMQFFFPLFIYLNVGWDALAKARRGKEKNRSEKRTLTGRHPGVVIPSQRSCILLTSAAIVWYSGTYTKWPPVS